MSKKTSSKKRRAPSRPADEARAARVERLVAAIRATSTAAVLLHAAISDRINLSASDARVLDLLKRVGPLTAGELAKKTGLATASVTSLIDRLEERRFARRVRDPADRRRVIVEATSDRDGELAALYSPLATQTTAFLNRYDDAQLETIADFLERSAAGTHAHLAALAGERAD